MEGSKNTKIEGASITITCISEEARDLLNSIMEKWEEHEARMREYAKQRGVEPGEISHYGFAYWLVRYSGLIQPSNRQ